MAAARTEFALIALIAILLVALLFIAGIITLIVLLVRWANRQKPAAASTKNTELRKTLAETLKEHRTKSGMTQEYVAEALGVSRQAVSKWEIGASEPSTTNLIAIAKLYGVSPDELLGAITKR